MQSDCAHLQQFLQLNTVDTAGTVAAMLTTLLLLGTRSTLFRTTIRLFPLSTLLNFGLLEETGTCRGQVNVDTVQTLAGTAYDCLLSIPQIERLCDKTSPKQILTRASRTSRTRSTPLITRCSAAIAFAIWPGYHVILPIEIVSLAQVPRLEYNTFDKSAWPQVLLWRSMLEQVGCNDKCLTEQV